MRNMSAREELSFIDGRVEELEELIKQAVLIQESHVKRESCRKAWFNRYVAS